LSEEEKIRGFEGLSDHTHLSAANICLEQVKEERVMEMNENTQSSGKQSDQNEPQLGRPQASQSQRMLIGSHVSMSGAKMLVEAAEEGIDFDASTIMVFTGAPQNTRRKDISRFHIAQGRALLDEHHISPLIVHAPYIINLANTKNPKAHDFGVQFMLGELKRAEAIGASDISFHPGAHVGAGTDKGIDQLARSLSEILEKTDTTKVRIAVETMAGKGSEICVNFQQMGKLLKLVGSPRLCVTFDTCHVYDSGYDLKNHMDDVFSQFSDDIGLDKLTVFHLNDSKFGLSSHKDRHANIGFGKLGWDALYRIATMKQFAHVPKILETPAIPDPADKHTRYNSYKREIAELRAGTFDPQLPEKVLADNGRASSPVTSQ
jgi:deoxyribonuclease-4